jgi:hypothetical protein
VWQPGARPERRASVAQDGVGRVVSEAHKAARENGEPGEQVFTVEQWWRPRKKTQMTAKELSTPRRLVLKVRRRRCCH